jgi:hypothetical protein
VKRVQVFIGCDSHYAEGGELISSDETIYIAAGPDPDHLKVREVDLCAACALELRGRLQPFLDASHDPGEMDTPAGSTEHKTPRRMRPTAESMAYNDGMREWADRTGYTQPEGKPGYRQLGGRGGYYHSVALKRAYAEMLTGREDLLRSLNGNLGDAEVIS